MSFGLGMNSSDASSNQRFNQSIPAFQQDALKSLYSNAANFYKQMSGQMLGQAGNTIGTTNNLINAANPAYRSQLAGGAYGGLNIGNQLMSSLNSSLGNPTQTSKVYADIMGGSGNNYADALKDSYIHDADLAAKNMLQNLDARATASGMSGSSRHGIAEGLGIQGINSNLQQNLAKTGYDTFQQDLTNKLNIAQQADQNTFNRQQMMADLLNNQNQTQANAINFGSGLNSMNMGNLNSLLMPGQILNQYSGAIGNPIVLSSGIGNSNANSFGFNHSGSMKN